MKLAILTTLITAASAFVTPGARAPTKTFLRAEEEAAAADDEVPEFRGAMEIAALTASINNPVFDSEEISRTLPHRYPFLLVDKVIEYEAGKVRNLCTYHAVPYVYVMTLMPYSQ